ncbi:MAG: NAD(P)/FAD-dependent oxidoreductase [Candidatus Nealsonbacteria bacterium]|nr:NAD(P)/FAD-dependent oxidoreductase [Candidatus Nealsonbacteria bacterium]
MARNEHYDVLIVGGGPAGIAAACCAARAGRRVAIVDDNPAQGGQIWRGMTEEWTAATQSPLAASWLRRLREAKVEVLAGTQIVARPRDGVLLAETDADACLLAYDKLILAAGARERFLPFPGWTLPGVTGAGGLQSLVKSGLPIAGRRVAVAGSGPVLLAVADCLRDHGAEICLIAEQAPWPRLVRFGCGLIGSPGKLLQGAGYKWRLKTVRYRTGCWPVAAEGDGKLSSVTFHAGSKTRTVACDYLACGFGFVPSLELPTLLDCRLDGGAVWIDDWQETSVQGIYAAGETTGVGGVDLALIEGQIAGYAAIDCQDHAARLFRARERGRRFVGALDRAFALREELKSLATAETPVCRCEDVSRQQLEAYGSWREAKLQTRCGMGPCQGRVCGTAAEFLFDWQRESIRPPIFPADVGTLAEIRPLGKQPGK